MDHVGTVTAPARPSGTALVLGRYRLERRLGSGGFGTVWLAHDEQLHRAVAVKRIPVSGDDPDRATREAHAAARLAHPGIVALYEAGADDEACYLVSELVRGDTLADLLAEGCLSDRDVVRIGVALCDALAHAHARGVIHRDVKPSNVMVPDRPEDGGGIAKLTDFGIARIVGGEALTRTGDVVGTLAYMAPEQAEGRTITPAVDLYALGLVLFESLSGINPVRGAGPADTARRVGEPLPELRRLRRDLPPDLCDAIDDAVEVDPADRGSVPELREALAAAVADVDDEPGTAEGSFADTLTQSARTWRGRAEEVRAWRPGDARAPEPFRPVAGERSRRPVAPAARVGAALATAALVAAASAWLGLGEISPLAPAPAGGLAALLVVFAPRLGWLAVAGTCCIWLAGGGHAGAALVLGVALAPIPLLLIRAPAAWSLPAAAPALGLIGLAGAFPALAGQARTLPHRAILGALGGLWLTLAEPLLAQRLFAGPVTRAPRGAWDGSATAAADLVVGEVLTSPLLAVAAAWALAAAVLPWIVRGGSAVRDAVAAAAWAAALAGATVAVLAEPPRGAVTGAVAAAIVAVAARAARAGSAGRAPLP